MSGYAVDWVWTLARPRNGQRLVLACLASHARSDGICWPGENKLVRETMLGRRCVRRALRALERAGEIEVRQAMLGRRPITVYRLAWPGRRPFDADNYEWTLDRPFWPEPVPVMELVAGGDRRRPYGVEPPPRFELIPGGREA